MKLSTSFKLNLVTKESEVRDLSPTRHEIKTMSSLESLDFD